MIITDAYLHYLANLATEDKSKHDDLVQEGRIKVWQLQERFADKPRQYFVVAVKKRMMDLCTGNGRSTGHTGRRGVTDATAVKPAELETLLGDPAFDERRLRPPVAASKAMSAANVRAYVNA
jgi:DNA-directed RNA polymerase specialized sigma24 family protein